MNNIVRFSVGCMGLIMVGFVVLMYFGWTDTPKPESPEEQAQARVRKWMNRVFKGQEERVLVTLGREYTFEGEDKRYRMADFRVKGAPEPAKVERYVLQTNAEGTVTYHWTVPEFIKAKKDAAKAESTPERVAWQEQRWQAMLKEMGLDNVVAPVPAKPASAGSK